MGYVQKSIYKSAIIQGLSTPLRLVHSTQRQNLIKSAGDWCGTPFKHQGREKGVGSDCIGLVIGLAREYEFDKIVSFTEFRNYGRNPNGHMMSDMLKKYLRKISICDALPGDILHLSFIQFPQHVVMLMPDGCIIHAYEPNDKVIYHRINDFWASRVVSAYRYMGLN